MRLLAALLTLLLLTRAAQAGQLEDGIAAYEAKDYSSALSLLRPLAESGDAEAAYLLGNMTSFGWGVQKDDVQGADWYERAAAAGHTKALFNLGIAYYRGEGRPLDRTKAFTLIEQAARQCLVEAQTLAAG